MLLFVKVPLHIYSVICNINYFSYSKILSKSVVGASGNEDLDNKSDMSMEDDLMVKEDCYQVVGTLKDPSSKAPDWVYEIYEVSR